MKLLLWAPLAPPDVGGIETLVGDMAGGLRSRGHEPCVLAGVGPRSQEGDGLLAGVPVRRLPFWQVLERRDLRGLARVRAAVDAWMAAHEPEVVHLHFSGPTAYFHAGSRHGRRPTVLTVHGSLQGLAGGPGTLLGRALRQAARVVAVSSATAEDAAACAERPVRVIHNGRPVPPEPEGRPQPGLLLAAGRLTAEKGFDRAIAALAAVRTSVPAARLEIAGEGPERPRLEREAQALGLSAHVAFLGLLDAAGMRDALARCSAVVVSSHTEGFPLVAVEAALAGRPVVAVAVGGLAECVVHGETGLLAADAPRGLADAAASLLSRPGEAARMGAAARRRAVGELGLDRCLDAYEEEYRAARAGPA